MWVVVNYSKANDRLRTLKPSSMWKRFNLCTQRRGGGKAVLKTVEFYDIITDDYLQVEHMYSFCHCSTTNAFLKNDWALTCLPSYITSKMNCIHNS